MSDQVIEWAAFRLKEGVSDSTLFAASETIQQEFLKRQKGFIKRDLVKESDGKWVDVVYWESHQNAEDAMKQTMNSPVCLKYFEIMTDVNVSHLNVVKSYS